MARRIPKVLDYLCGIRAAARLASRIMIPDSTSTEFLSLAARRDRPPLTVRNLRSFSLTETAAEPQREVSLM